MRNVRVLFFGLAALYLVGVVVQFFLAGLAAFGATTFDPHRALGFILGFVALALLGMAIAGRLPRPIFLFTTLLVGLNALQIVLANLDVAEIAALHVVNALAVFYIAHEVLQRSQSYLASKIAA